MIIENSKFSNQKKVSKFLNRTSNSKNFLWITVSLLSSGSSYDEHVLQELKYIKVWRLSLTPAGRNYVITFPAIYKSKSKHKKGIQISQIK